MSKEGLMAIAVLVLFALVVLAKVESLWARILLIGIVAWVGYSSSALMAMMVAGVLAVLVLVNPLATALGLSRLRMRWEIPELGRG